MNKENDCNQVTEASMVESIIEQVTQEETVIAINVMNLEKAVGSFQICAEISPTEEVRSSVIMELCQHGLDVKGMLDE